MGRTSNAYKTFLLSPKRGWLRALKLNKRRVWQVAVYYNRKYSYLCTAPPNPSLSVVLKCIRKKYGVVKYTRRNPDKFRIHPQTLCDDVEVNFDGCKYVGRLAIRLSRGRPFLCVCQGFKILKTLHYLNRENLRRLLQASSERELFAIVNSLSPRFKALLHVEEEEGVESWGYEALQSKKETWGAEVDQDSEETWEDDYWLDLIDTWGVGVLKEEADPETIKELYRKGIINCEEYAWLMEDYGEEECGGG